MQITMPHDRTDALVDELAGVWRASVEATHDFLGAQDVDRIAARAWGQCCWTSRYANWASRTWT